MYPPIVIHSLILYLNWDTVKTLVAYLTSNGLTLLRAPNDFNICSKNVKE